MDLKITNIRCLSYNDTVTKSGSKYAATTGNINPNGICVYMYFYRHAVGYMTKDKPSLNDTFNIVNEILLNIVK